MILLVIEDGILAILMRKVMDSRVFLLIVRKVSLKVVDVEL